MRALGAAITVITVPIIPRSVEPSLDAAGNCPARPAFHPFGVSDVDGVRVARRDPQFSAQRPQTSIDPVCGKRLDLGETGGQLGLTKGLIGISYVFDAITRVVPSHTHRVTSEQHPGRLATAMSRTRVLVYDIDTDNTPSDISPQELTDERRFVGEVHQITGGPGALTCWRNRRHRWMLCRCRGRRRLRHRRRGHLQRGQRRDVRDRRCRRRRCRRGGASRARPDND